MPLRSTGMSNSTVPPLSGVSRGYTVGSATSKAHDRYYYTISAVARALAWIQVH